MFISYYKKEFKHSLDLLWDERGSIKFVGKHFVTPPIGFNDGLSLEKRMNF